MKFRYLLIISLPLFFSCNNSKISEIPNPIPLKISKNVLHSDLTAKKTSGQQKIETSYPKEVSNYPVIEQVSDKHLLLYGIADQPISIYNLRKGKKRDLPFIRYFNNFDYINNIMINRSLVAVNREDNIFFVALDILDRVVLFNKRGNISRQIIFSNPEPFDSGKFCSHFGDIFWAGKYCYLHRYEKKMSAESSRLIVLDKRGRLVKSYSSPVGFGNVSVSEDGKIFSSIPGEDDTVLYQLTE